jgi:signal transduction histidine kinase
LQGYAFFNAHILRRPVANILGLLRLFKLEDSQSGKEEVVQHLYSAVEELNGVVRQIQEIVEEK